MPKKLHIHFNDAQMKMLDFLKEKWGYDTFSMIIKRLVSDEYNKIILEETRGKYKKKITEIDGVIGEEIG